VFKNVVRILVLPLF